jgi:hypothetical protein
MARLLLILIVVLGATLVPAAPAWAGAEWCDTDLPLFVEASDGGVIAVYLLVGVRGAEHLPAALAASLNAAAEPVEAAGSGRALRVAATVTVPGDQFGQGFPTRALVSSGPLGTGAVYAATEGTSGQEMTLRFTLPHP